MIKTQKMLHQEQVDHENQQSQNKGPSKLRRMCGKVGIVVEMHDVVTVKKKVCQKMRADLPSWIEGRFSLPLPARITC